MNKRRELDNFTTVFTNADLADTPEGAMEVCQNLRRLPGKLVKTYGAGYIQDGDSQVPSENNVCPITVASGYSVINIYCYINENLTDGREYLAVIANDTTGQVWIVKFDSAYNVASGEPATLLPFGSDSFWVKGINQTFNNWGRLMLTNVSAESGANSYDFPATSTFHIPNQIDGTSGADKIAFGNMKSDIGRDFYEAGDVESSVFSDTVAFVNQDVATFSGSSEFGIARFARASGVTFAITNSPDKLYWYDTSGGWTLIDPAAYGVTWQAGDKLSLLNITEMGGDIYLTYRHYDASDTGAEYHYRMSRLTGISSAFSWVNSLYSEDLAADYFALLGPLYQDSATSFTFTDGVEKVAIYINGSTVNTTCPGKFLVYDTTNGISTIAFPTFGNVRNRTVVGVAYVPSSDLVMMMVNNTSDSVMELYSTARATVSWSEVTLPSNIDGLGLRSWDEGHFLGTVPASDVLPMVVSLTEGGATSYCLVEYDVVAGTFTGDDSFELDTAGYTIHGFYVSYHLNRTGTYYLTGVRETTKPTSSVLITAPDLNTRSLFSDDTNNLPMPAIISYEIEYSHITSISFLFGTYDDSEIVDPTIERIVSFGANPDYSPYGGVIPYQASFTACMGWIELFQSLPIDQEFNLYHKVDRNPIVMENGILRLFPGGIGVDIDTGLIEAKGLWIGYIDRDFYDGLYSAGSEYTASFVAYDKAIIHPTAYANGTGLAPDILLAGWDAADEARYVRYSFIYDGVQESLLSAMVTTNVDTQIDKAVFRLKLFDGVAGDVRDSRRITGVRVYSMASASDSAVATLIREINFTLKAEARELYSTTGAGYNSIWLNDTGITTEAAVGRYVFPDDGISSPAGAEILTSTELSDGTWLITIAGPLDPNVGGSSWDVTINLGPDATYANIDYNSTGSYSANVSAGDSVLIDGTVEFDGLNPLALTMAGVNPTTGGAAFATNNGDNDTFAVTEVQNHAILLSAEDCNVGGAITYHLNAQPYVFYTLSSAYYLYSILDFANPQGDAYGLQGAKYIKVNPDFAKIMAGRLFTLSNILDPGGENEEQLTSLGYSEYEQYDVLPVGNLIKFNDREGGGGTGLEELFGRPVVAFKQGLSILNVSDVSPANWVISESPHNIGNIAKQGMVAAQGKVYVCYYDGIYALTANNLAETDMTPTDRLKISFPIEDKYLALPQAQKEAIVGEYDQSKEEILWQLGDEQWAYSTDTGYWREVLQYITGSTKTTIDIITIDENADLMFYDETDDAIRSFTNPAAVPTLMKSKVYNIAIERDELLRYMWVFNPYSDAMTITPYMDGVALSTTVVAASTAKQKIVVKKRGLNFQVQVEWASSTNDNQILRIGLEYDN